MDVETVLVSRAHRSYLAIFEFGCDCLLSVRFVGRNSVSCVFARHVWKKAWGADDLFRFFLSLESGVLLKFTARKSCVHFAFVKISSFALSVYVVLRVIKTCR